MHVIAFDTNQYFLLAMNIVVGSWTCAGLYATKVTVAKCKSHYARSTISCPYCRINKHVLLSSSSFLLYFCCPCLMIDSCLMIGCLTSLVCAATCLPPLHISANYHWVLWVIYISVYHRSVLFFLVLQGGVNFKTLLVFISLILVHRGFISSIMKQTMFIHLQLWIGIRAFCICSVCCWQNHNLNDRKLVSSLQSQIWWKLPRLDYIIFTVWIMCT